MSLFINIVRPAEPINFWNTYAGSVFLLILSGAILVTARFFPLEKIPLGFCVFLHLTGFPCPTCGFTRAFCDFANGNWSAGFYLCPFVCILFIITVAVVVYNAVVIVAGLFGVRVQLGNFFQLSTRKTIVLAVFFSLLLMANWIYRLIMGLK